MANHESPIGGTLIIASLLVLAIIFTGVWIFIFVIPGSNPWAIIPWFAVAAGAIIVVGLASIVLQRWRRP